MMQLSVHEFDQTSEGWRKYSEYYPEVTELMKLYISSNVISNDKAKNIRWHMGQIHAGNNNYKAAVENMRLSYLPNDPKWWLLYVKGTMAFLENDKTSLAQALDSLAQESNQTNIEILRKLQKGFGKTYKEALSMQD